MNAAVWLLELRIRSFGKCLSENAVHQIKANCKCCILNEEHWAHVFPEWTWKCDYLWVSLKPPIASGICCSWMITQYWWGRSGCVQIPYLLATALQPVLSGLWEDSVSAVPPADHTGLQTVRLMGYWYPEPSVPEHWAQTGGPAGVCWRARYGQGPVRLMGVLEA